uniref:Uncharacterized protein n=1 Tax=Triticum aestivum TaxID=4565 RepID=A0A077RPD7_WHEAT|nr:unnamed protein product [Triticum aestivum]
MGLFSSSGSKSKGKAPVVPFPAEFTPPPPAPARRQRQRVNVPVHQAEWHWCHRVPLPYPEMTLPHGWHLDPERIPVPVAPRLARTHAEEVRRRRALLPLEQRRDEAYAFDSPNWARWFAFEHEEARRRSVRERLPGGPCGRLPGERGGQAAQGGGGRRGRGSVRGDMGQAMALFAAGDYVVPPVASSSPPRRLVKADLEPQPEPQPGSIASFSWTGVVREWVSAPPVWMEATLAQEAAYLEHWRQRRLAEERRQGEYEEMLERDLEEEAREAEEEARQAAAAQAAAQPPAPELPPADTTPAGTDTPGLRRRCMGHGVPLGRPSADAHRPHRPRGRRRQRRLRCARQRAAS